MLVRDLIRQLSDYNQDAEVRISAACMYEGDEDTLMADVIGVSESLGTIYIDADGVSNEDREEHPDDY